MQVTQTEIKGKLEKHIEEGTDVKTDIATLKADVKNIKEHQ